MFCFLPHAFLQGTPLCDPERDLFKAIPISVRQPATPHHRPTFFGRSLEQALVPTSTLCAQKDQTSAFKSALSWAAWPFDLCKKASLCVLKSSWLFVATTGALLPSANAAFKHGEQDRIFYYQDLAYMSLGLSPNWDRSTCPGRALSINDIQTIHDKKNRCRDDACIQRLSPLCDRLNPDHSARYEQAFERLCDPLICSPNLVLRSSTKHIQKNIKLCKRNACQQTGHPYTGRFSRTAPAQSISNAQQKTIDEAILKNEACFETFCQSYAQDICASKPSWWQSLFGISPCNDNLCPGRFLQDKSEEVSPGVFKTLAQIGAEGPYKSVKRPKRAPRQHNHCRHITVKGVLRCLQQVPPLDHQDARCWRHML